MAAFPAMYQHPRTCATRILLAACTLILLAIAGCSSTPQTRHLAEHPPADIATAKILSATPFIPQQAYQCGPAALAMTLADSGVAVAADDLVPMVYVPGRQGSFQVEMLAAARQYNRLPLSIETDLNSLLRWIDAGKPVLVLQNLGLDWYQKWHYAVVIGYDLGTREIILHSGTIANYRVSMALFERTWRRGDYWGLALLKPGELPVRENPQTYFLAAATLEETHPDADLLAIWRAGVESWPAFPPLAMALANHHYSRGNRDGARQGYQAIIRQHPTYLPAYNNLATLLTELGQYGEAVTLARQGLAIAGGTNPALEETLAAAMAQQR